MCGPRNKPNKQTVPSELWAHVFFLFYLSGTVSCELPGSIRVLHCTLPARQSLIRAPGRVLSCLRSLGTLRSTLHGLPIHCSEKGLVECLHGWTLGSQLNPLLCRPNLRSNGPRENLLHPSPQASSVPLGCIQNLLQGSPFPASCTSA